MLDPILAHLIEEAMVLAGVTVAVVSATVIKIRRDKGAQARELGTDANRSLDEIKAQLQRLEAAVDTSAVEIERISEAQRFTSRLLAERGATDRSPALDAKVDRRNRT